MLRFGFAGLVALAIVGLISGCASPKPPGAGTMPSTVHEASDPASIKIYDKAPKSFEMLQVITLVAAPEYKMDERGDASKGFAKLREKAAALGANGILLDIDPTLSDILVQVAEKGTYYQVPVRLNPQRTAVVGAIFVHKEK